MKDLDALIVAKGNEGGNIRSLKSSALQ